MPQPRQNHPEPDQSPARIAAGFYHDPPIWIGSSPLGETPMQAPDFESFREFVFEASLGGIVDMRASREGLFVFSFANWAPGCFSSDAEEATTFHHMAEVVLNRTLVMNAFLAFFYTASVNVRRQALRRMVVTPELVIPTGGLSYETGMGFGNTHVANLVMSSYQSTYRADIPAAMDSRLLTRGDAIELRVLEEAANSLSTLLSDNETESLLLIDLFLRATKAHQDHNYSAALIDSWTVTEKLL